MDNLIETIQVTEEIDLLLYENEDPKEGCYISIKHKPVPRDMPGEVFVPPGHVPDLVQPLTSAAIKLSSQGYYFMGYADGIEAEEPDKMDMIVKYHTTQAGQNEIQKAEKNQLRIVKKPREDSNKI